MLRSQQNDILTSDTQHLLAKQSLSRLPGFCFVCCWWKLNPFLAPGLIRFVTCLTTSAALTARSRSQANNKRASLSSSGSGIRAFSSSSGVLQVTPFWGFYFSWAVWMTNVVHRGEVEISKDEDWCVSCFSPAQLSSCHLIARDKIRPIKLERISKS